MKAIATGAMVALLSVACMHGPAEAKGCIKGAIIGGIAGHFAGHHGLLGAGAGCAVGHHYANKHERTNSTSSHER